MWLLLLVNVVEIIKFMVINYDSAMNIPLIKQNKKKLLLKLSVFFAICS
jgi:hypothetical protein